MNNQKGMALPLVIIVMTFLIILGGSLLNTELGEVYTNVRDENKTEAYYVARSAAEGVLDYLMDNADDVNGISTVSNPTEIPYATVAYESGLAEMYVLYNGMDANTGELYFTLVSQGIVDGVKDRVEIDMVKRRSSLFNYNMFENAISTMGTVSIKNLNISSLDDALENSLLVDYSGDLYVYDDDLGNEDVPVNPLGEDVWVQYIGPNDYPYSAIVFFEDGDGDPNTEDAILTNENTDYDYDGNTYRRNDDETYEIGGMLYSYYEYDDDDNIVLCQVLNPAHPDVPDVDSDGVADTHSAGKQILIPPPEEPLGGFPKPVIPNIADVDVDEDGVRDDLIVPSNTTQDIYDSGYYTNFSSASNSVLRFHVESGHVLQIRAENVIINGTIQVVDDDGDPSTTPGTVHFIFDDYMEIGTNNAVNDAASKLIIIYSDDPAYTDIEDDFVVLNGQADLFGYIYAPAAQSSFDAGATITGAMILDTLSGNGQPDMVYDPSFEGLDAELIITLGPYEIVPTRYR